MANRSSTGRFTEEHPVAAMTTQANVSLYGAAAAFVVRDILRALSITVTYSVSEPSSPNHPPTFHAGVERDGVVIHLQAADSLLR
jgi:hypothetical protein